MLVGAVGPTGRAQAAAHRTVATLALRHGVVGIDALSNGHVLIGASTDSGNATVNLSVGAAQDLADSIARITARRVGSRTTRVYRTVAADPATGAGVEFARHVTKGASAYRLFFANGGNTGFPLDVSARELALVLRAVRRATHLARTLTAADSA
ncbi:MAG TPA: hypothetical protein VIC24_05970 [Gemmatimonadaceae bacterium]